MIHYPPTWNHDVYMFERCLGKERVMTVANGETQARVVQLPAGVRRVRNLLTGQEETVPPQVPLPGMTAQVWLVVAPQDSAHQE